MCGFQQAFHSGDGIFRDRTPGKCLSLSARAGSHSLITGPLALTESTLISLPGSWALPGYLVPLGVMSTQHSAAGAEGQSVQTVLQVASGALSELVTSRRGRQVERCRQVHISSFSVRFLRMTFLVTDRP